MLLLMGATIFFSPLVLPFMLHGCMDAWMHAGLPSFEPVNIDMAKVPSIEDIRGTALKHLTE
jgi:hypothetical protein